MKLFFTKFFKVQLKKLSKKFPNVKNDLLDELEDFDLSSGVYIGRSIYNVRVASSDQKKGKSGGFRSYVYMFKRGELLVPLCIYSKGAKGSITENELKYYFDRAIDELL